MYWDSLQAIPSRQFACGYCGNSVASVRGWKASTQQNAEPTIYIHICPHCTKPTFFESRALQAPGVKVGESVKDIPDSSVENLYEEARATTGAGAYTAAVLCCRKLLMHIAVSKGAGVGDSFIHYVQFLADNHFIPPDAKDWVDHIRTKGNEANHEIVIMNKDDAKELLLFSQMLLKVIYEFPAAVKRKITKP
jgi:Domain of unknown function (DUF4145)